MIPVVLCKRDNSACFQSLPSTVLDPLGWLSLILNIGKDIAADQYSFSH